MNHDTGHRARRGRIVMLVDNAVVDDPRAHKTARSAAEAGWEVTLVGRSPDRTERTWRLGAAEVRLVPVPDTLGMARREFRRSWARRPLAYPPGHTRRWRQAKVDARRAALAERRAAVETSGSAVWKPLRRGRLRMSELLAAGERRWVGLRGRHTDAAARDGGSRWERGAVWWWKTVRPKGCWRRLHPHLWDYEAAYGPVIDALAPDLIHANGFRMLGVGARARLRARASGRDSRLVWEAQENLPDAADAEDGRWLAAMRAHEAEYARHADEVVTVSEELAELLRRRHRLPRLPTVVLDVPDAALAGDGVAAVDIRRHCGIGPADPLLVYSGVPAAERGLDLMVRALPRLPDVHVALVVNDPEAPHVAELVERAAALGAASRLHVLPYVPHPQVVSYVSGADVGVLPLRHKPNHEIALSGTFFEYAHARLPLVVSDVRTMARTTHSTGQGEVFWADNLNDFVRAVNAVLSDPGGYRQAYDRDGLLDAWTWRHQASILDTVYAKAMAHGEGPRAIASVINQPHRRSSSDTRDDAASVDTH